MADSVVCVPELPEVESVRRQLHPALVGRVVVAAWVDRDGPRTSPVEHAAGLEVLDVVRRGKYLLLPLGDVEDGAEAELVLHLGMTGRFRIADGPQHPDLGHVRARFELDDGTWLLFDDVRRFGRVNLVEPGDHAGIPTLAALGPEPLSDDFDADAFAAALAATSAPVKARLLDQRLVAGVGNIYADEALWLARIHPRSRRVGRARAHRLHAAVREVIAAAIEREGTTFRDYEMVNGQSGRNADFLVAYGRADLPCQRCGTPMRRTVVAQRGTTYCPDCQRA